MTHQVNIVEAVQWTQKVWGETVCVIRKDNFEVHHLRIKPGGYCSRHHHAAKWNRFSVLVGQLQVRIYNGVDETLMLGVGDTFDVRPGVQHRFFSPVGCEAIEVYWPDHIDLGDIVREDEGGMAEPGLFPNHL